MFENFPGRRSTLPYPDLENMEGWGGNVFSTNNTINNFLLLTFSFTKQITQCASCILLLLCNSWIK